MIRNRCCLPFRQSSPWTTCISFWRLFFSQSELCEICPRVQRVIDLRSCDGTMWTPVFSLETEGLCNFTQCRDMTTVNLCAHDYRAIQHIPAHLSFGAVTCNRDNYLASVVTERSGLTCHSLPPISMSLPFSNSIDHERRFGACRSIGTVHLLQALFASST